VSESRRKDAEEMRLCLLLVLSVSVFPSNAQTNSYERGRFDNQQALRKICRNASPQFAKDAVTFSEKILQIAANDSFTHVEKRTRLKKFMSVEGQRYLDKWSEATRKYLRSDDPDQMLLGTAYAKLGSFVPLLVFDNPGESLGWYDDRLFTYCTSN
jgi:hypothetical protein